jgi:membrane fusion protein, macrolide-specific efflux system
MSIINSAKLSFPKLKKWFIKASLRKKLLVAGVVVLISGLIVSRIVGAGQSKQQYQTSQVQRGSIISTVNESGNIASNSQGGVGSPTNGIVEEVYVKNGDTVTQGQNLFKVKSTASAQEIASAWASYQNAVSSANSATINKTVSQATLEKDRAAVIAASTNVTNMQNNLNVSQPNPATKQAYTQNDIDAINSALTSARETFSADEQKFNQSGQSINASDASLNSAWLAYEATQDSVVTAPIGGTVANISVKPGDQVTATGGSLSSNNSSSNSSSSSSSSNAILYIGDYSKPYVRVQANEVDIVNIHAGQKATITLSAFPDKTFVGAVDQVDTAGAISSGVVTYNIFVTFVVPPSDIKPGMSASVTIQTARKDNVIMVPTAAVQTSNGQSTVRVLESGKISSVPVETGLSSDSDIEITSGLSEGDTVVTSIIASTTQSTGQTTSPFSGLGGRGFGGGGFTGGGNRGGR